MKASGVCPLSAASFLILQWRLSLFICMSESCGSGSVPSGCLCSVLVSAMLLSVLADNWPARACLGSLDFRACVGEPFRVRLFRSLLAQLPKSRSRLTEEAGVDIPPLLRPQVFPSLLLPVAAVETAQTWSEREV